MGAVVDVGLPFDVVLGDWEVGAAQVCAMTLVDGADVRSRAWFERDPEGRLLRRVRTEPGSARRTEVRHRYDALGRLIGTEAWTVDAGGPERTEATTYRRDDRGRIAEVQTERWSRAYATDDPATDTRTHHVSTSTWTYDAAGRVVGTGPPEGSHTEIVRDSSGRITAITNVSVWTPLATKADGPVPGPRTRREPFVTVAWSADGRSATETIVSGRPIAVSWTLDPDGVPLTTVAQPNPPSTEVATWHRDCAGLPPVPR